MPPTSTGPPSRGTLHVRVLDDLILDAGTWQLDSVADQRRIARIVPPAMAMSQQVVAYLEAKPVPQGGNFRRDSEARAAVAVCLRWGSYFAVLTDPYRPAAPDIEDKQISQIHDDEMARMNIEISAALAWWLALRGADDRCYWDLVHRTLEYLPVGPKTVRPLAGDEFLLATAVPTLAAKARDSWSPDRLESDLGLAENHCIRIIANTITHHAWRNGPIEGVHAGGGDGYGLGERRVLPQAEKAIIRQAQSGFSTGLKAVDWLKYDHAWPPPAERALPFLHPLVRPSSWSLTDLSRMVELPLRVGGRNGL